MNKRHVIKFRLVVRLLSIILTAALLLPYGLVWAGDPAPLNQVPIPTPPNLGDFVKDKAAAIQLGKALFWDMNAGGDGGQACATCHYRAGADPINTGPGAPGYPNANNLRATNQVNPGPNGAFNTVTAPNQILTSGMFPFVQVTDPATAKLQDTLSFTREWDDVAGSQGVSLNIFNNTQFGNPRDSGSPVADPTYTHSRRVTGRNTPPAVNAVFNYANFWDGRANNIFNGSSPLGPLDASAGIWVNTTPSDSPTLEFQKIAIPNASLASQAVGPPNNNTEMSWDGRNWPQLGNKFLDNGLNPLRQQLVSPNDSALGILSCQTHTTGAVCAGNPDPAKGINISYAQMIQKAFYEKYWNSFSHNININGSNYTQMEANFSLFWGISVMLYEATLVSDQTPFDQYLGGTTSAMTDTQIKGFGIFKSKCAMCHSGSELSDATVSNALANGLIDKGVTRSGGAISDIGYANLGVSPTSHDIGRGGIGGSPNAIASFSGEAIAQAKGTLAFTAPQAIFDGITANTPVAVNGSFKTPMLRNIALTAPYMHNGSMLTLAEVVDFYARGGNYANAEQANEINQPVGLNANDRTALVDFLQNALTDPRVAAESAPFDHPELSIPDGTSATLNDNNTDPKLTRTVTGTGTGNILTDLASILSKPTETMTLADLPQPEITGLPASGMSSSQNVTFNVGGPNVATVDVLVDGATVLTGVPAGAVTVTLPNDGQPHNISAIGFSSSGPGYAKVAVVAGTGGTGGGGGAVAAAVAVVGPAQVTMDPLPALSKLTTQTISGTENGAVTMTVSVNNGPAVPAAITGAGKIKNWSAQVSGMAIGDNTITVTTVDAAVPPATTIQTRTMKIAAADGCFSGTGAATVADALKALRMSVGIIAPAANDMLHGDMNLDGKIDSGDCLLILKKAVGL